jgi:hypothetical protein
MEDFFELEQGTDLLLDENGSDFLLLESSGHEVVTVQQDTWLDGETPSATNGSSTSLIAALSYSSFRHVMIEFDMPGTDLGTITDINLMLYNVGGYDPGLVCDMYRTNNTTWSASTATYTSDNTNYTGSVIDSKTGTGAAGWTVWHVMGSNAINSYSRTWGDNVSLMIRATGTNNAFWKGFNFASNEYAVDTTKRPYLSVIYTTTGGSTATQNLMMMGVG